MAARARYNLAMPFKAAASDLLHFLNGVLSLGNKPTAGQVLTSDGTTVTGGALGGGGTPTPTAVGDMIASTDGSTWAKRTVAEVRTLLAGLLASNNLSDVGSALTARANLKVPRTYNTTTDPGSATTADGVAFVVGDHWLNTSSGVEWVYNASADWRSLLRVEAAIVRPVGGVLKWTPQVWSGSAWANAGASTDLTVETAGSFTFDGSNFIIPSGLTNSTQPHTSQFKAYLPLSSLPFWSASAGATYRVEMGETSMGTDSDFARWGWALAFPTGAYDSSAETLLGGRYGRNTGSAVWTWTEADGTSSWTSVYSNAAVAVNRFITFLSGVARAIAYSDGGATATAALAQPVTAATHLYWLGAGSGVTTAPVTVVGPWIRIIRLSGSP